MELTEKTLNILKNFASIQPNIVFRGTNVVRTIAEARNIVAQATLDSVPPDEVGIYDLNEFLGTLTLVDNPNLEFKKDHAVISGGSGHGKIKYFFSDPEMLTSPSKEIVLPSEEVHFVLDNDTLSKIKKAASTLGHTQVAIFGKKKLLELQVTDPENKTANTYTIEIPGEFDEASTFKFVFNITNLKMIPGDYKVALSKKLYAHLESKTEKLEYWIAMEKSSEYRTNV